MSLQTGIDFLTTVHTATRNIAGVQVTFGNQVGAVTGLVASIDLPSPAAGLDGGYEDARTEIDIAVLKSDYVGPPEGGTEVTIEGRQSVFAVKPGTISETAADWRMTVIELDMIVSDVWQWQDGDDLLWESGNPIETESA